MYNLKNMKKIKTLLYLSLTTINLNSQITIGSSEKPADGALLDLKQEGITTKGLGLPKVQLKKQIQTTKPNSLLLLEEMVAGI